MGVPLTIAPYLLAWQRAPEKPCKHDSEKPCVPCLRGRLHVRRFYAMHPGYAKVQGEKQRSTPGYKEKAKAWNRSWVDRNPVRHRELGASWKSRNLEKSRESIRRCRLKRIAADLQAVRAKYREDRARRRARLLNASLGPVSPSAIYLRDGGVCSICGFTVSQDTENNNLRASLDHVVPLSRGGSHDESNVRLAHALCNSVKHARECVPLASLEELRTRIAALIGGN